MTELEKLAKQIMAECEKDNEPVTFEEAIEMAKMEIGNKQIKRYEQSDKLRKKTIKTRKVDPIKADLADRFIVAIENYGGTVEPLKTETEIHFELGDDSYTLKLIKHRPPKNQAVVVLLTGGPDKISFIFFKSIDKIKLIVYTLRVVKKNTI